MVKDFTRTGSRPNDRYIKPEYLYLYNARKLLTAQYNAFHITMNMPDDKESATLAEYVRQCLKCRRNQTPARKLSVLIWNAYRPF